MQVLRHGLKVYQPKLSMNACIILEQIYGSVSKPLENQLPSTSDMVFIFSLSLDRYNLSEDEIYELVDSVEDLFSFIVALYEDSGIISQEEPQDTVQANSESLDDTSNRPSTFEEMSNNMVTQCLSMGLSRQEFYDSTLKEVIQFVDSYNNNKQLELEEKAFFDWMLANLIGSSVARLLSKNAKFPKLEEAYPFVKKGNNSDNEVQPMGEAEASILAWAMAMKDKQQHTGDRVE